MLRPAVTRQSVARRLLQGRPPRACCCVAQAWLSEGTAAVERPIEWNQYGVKLRKEPREVTWMEITGLTPYKAAWEWQKQQRKARIDDPTLPDIVLCLQHPPVYTLGFAAHEKWLKFNRHDTSIELHKVERGGQVTYHGPGQWVVYPILNLAHYRQDLRWYIGSLEELIIRTLAHWSLQGERIESMTGVWCNGVKIAAIGVAVSRWISMHGLALNVNPDLTAFDRIVACGLEGKTTSSMQRLVGPQTAVEMAQVQQQLLHNFSQVFAVSARHTVCDQLPPLAASSTSTTSINDTV